jgi:cellulose synthase/poly-beta-1,6-N-acetylglucosamine synthase-like glycosyltransferase
MRIFYSNPFSLDKNIGKAYNDYLSCLNAADDDWVVMQDGDIMYLTPDWGKRIHDALILDGGKFGLVGCYTNRLRSKHQLNQKEFSYDLNIRNHYEIANTYQSEGIQEIKEYIAGFFMAFQYKTWKKVKFKEDTLAFDSLFSMRVKELDLKIGLIRSLYVFHGYRLWADVEPWNDKKHLVK